MTTDFFRDPPRPPHPAKFSPQILEKIAALLTIHALQDHTLDDLKQPNYWILDPFAGVGGIHVLGNMINADYGWPVKVATEANELEPEWAMQATQVPRPDGAGLHSTVIGDWFDWQPHKNWQINAVVTSPTYANRMADHHNAKDGTKRLTYKHQLGRDLSPNNSGAMQWGDDYKRFHRRAWYKVYQILSDDGSGLFVINTKNHIRQGEVVPVTEFHHSIIRRMGFDLVTSVDVPVSGMGFGQHQTTLKIPHETVAVFRKVA